MKNFQKKIWQIPSRILILAIIFSIPHVAKSCIVPSVSNGKLGRLVSRENTRSQQFEEFQEGTRVKNNERAILLCNRGYYYPIEYIWGPVENMWGPYHQFMCRNGRWRSQPYCYPSPCLLDPPYSKHSHIVKLHRAHDSRVIYQCLLDFVMIKEADVVCHFGNWVGTPPVCTENRCLIDKINTQGLKVGSKHSYKGGEFFHIECNNGYEASNDNNGMMTCINGSWVGPMTPCTVKSCIVPSVSNGKLGRLLAGENTRRKQFKEFQEGTTVENNQTLILLCNRGYYYPVEYIWGQSEYIWGPYRFKCAKGKWRSQPYCYPSPCILDPPYSKHSQIVKLHRAHDSRVIYQCLLDFVMIKEADVVCQFGHWVGTPPVCAENLCLVDKINTQGLKVGRKLSYKGGEFFHIECINGYKASKDNNGMMTCINGSWIGSMTPCTVVSYCTLEVLLKRLPEDVVPSMENIQPSQTLPEGFEMKLHCERDLVLKGSPIVTCTSGLWRFGGPTSTTYCTPSCRLNVDASSRLNYYPKKEIFLPGDIVYFWCPYKYTMAPRVGKSMCLSGFWSNPTPDCIPL